MIEIILLWQLTKKIGQMAALKGHKSGIYKLTTVLLWFGGELTGALLGLAFGAGVGIYLFGLAGAGVGAAIAYNIAKNLPSADKPTSQSSDLSMPSWICPHCGRDNYPGSNTCAYCGKPPTTERGLTII